MEIAYYSNSSFWKLGHLAAYQVPVCIHSHFMLCSCIHVVTMLLSLLAYQLDIGVISRHLICPVPVFTLSPGCCHIA